MQLRGLLCLFCGVVFMVIFALLPSLAQAQQSESPVACDEASESIPLNYGDSTTGCSLSPAAELDTFTFLGSIGDQVRITVLGTSDELDPRLEIWDPDGIRIVDTSCNSGGGGGFQNCSIQVDPTTATPLPTLVTSGTYRVAVSEQQSNESGSYTLQLERIIPFIQLQDVAYNAAVIDSLNPATDSDLFTFEGAAGTDIRITVLGTSDELDPRLEIWDPDGIRIVDTSCNSGGGGGFQNCSIQVDPTTATPLPTLVTSGTYQVVISEQQSNELGGYQFDIQCIFGPCPTEQPDISVSPTSFDFGNIDIGFASAPQDLTISNNGNRNLIVSTITASSAFGIVNDNCSGQTLAPATSCTLGVVFAPAGAVPASPMLTIFSNDPDTPAFDVALTGGVAGGTVFGASVTTVEPNVVLCRNLTTGQSERLVTPGRSWDCEAAGLTLNSGDEVLTAIRGVAD